MSLKNELRHRMIERRNRRRGGGSVGIEKLTGDEARVSAYYFYKILNYLDRSDYSSYSGCESYLQTMFESYLKVLKREKIATIVFDKMIERHVRARRLVPVKKTSGTSADDDETVFDYTGKLKSHYRQDAKLIPRRWDFGTSSEFEINMSRALFADKKKRFGYLAGLCFFADESIINAPGNSLPSSVKIPQEIKKP